MIYQSKLKTLEKEDEKNITLAINWSMLKIATNMRKIIGKILSGKYSQKQFNHAKQSATDALKTALKRAIQKTAEKTDDLIGNIIANKITNVWRSSPQNNSEEVESDTENTGFDKEILT